MIETKFGTFDGNSWEQLCQLVFKSRYEHLEYQEMIASPGDFGIEGFTKKEGIVFQCYCPDFNYTKLELYEHQRDKITKDLNKLRKNQEEIQARLGEGVQIKQWIFVTPEVANNNLLAHAQKKQIDVLAWELPLISPEFSVLIYDSDFYAQEIHSIQLAQGKKLTLFSSVDISPDSEEFDVSQFEENINQKNEVRCTQDGVYNSKKHEKLNKITGDKWLRSDSFLRDLDRKSPEIHFHLMRVISQYESELEELSLTWIGKPEQLIDKVKDQLILRVKEAAPSLAETEIYRLSDQVTSKWIAQCPLNFEL